ncbi:MAG: efflux RND transporter periplasmic adaptor subunit [Phycisphaerae bacterium]|nr:efflux RND transporter periplasmic adaptor subunit [Phycisphaerae bacterium]
MRRSWLILLVVVVVVGGIWGWSAVQPEAKVEVIRPAVGNIRAYVEELAITELPHDYLVSMPIAGWLEGIDLREGDPVKTGQVIARLETDDLEDHVLQAEQRIAVLETRLRQTSDHRLEDNMLVEANATVKAIDETVKAAEAKIEASQAVAEFAQSEVNRLRKLRETDAAADRELRQVETDSRKAQAQYRSDLLELAALKTLAAVSYIGPKFIRDYKDRKSFELETYQKQLEEARSQLQVERRNLARAEIRSPIDGVVLNRHQTRRQYLPAGTPLLTLGRLADMEVTAEVLTERATRISPGDSVEVYGEAISTGPVSGKVLRVYPAGFKKISSLGVEQQRVKVAIKLDRQPERLGVEFRVHVRVYYDEEAGVLTLPRTALFRSDRGEWQVMLVRNGKTAPRTVQIGLMNDDQAEIVQGLTAEDLIVAQPSREIAPGMRVETVDLE